MKKPQSEISESGMLRDCIAEGCTTLVFGDGTCIAHDQPSIVADLLRGRPFAVPTHGEGDEGRVLEFVEAESGA